MTPNAPWKITDINAGLRLRQRGLSYTAIAVVLNEYHGLPLVSESAVRGMLRRYGAEPRPRGATAANLRRGSVVA